MYSAAVPHMHCIMLHSWQALTPHRPVTHSHTLRRCASVRGRTKTTERAPLRSGGRCPHCVAPVLGAPQTEGAAALSWHHPHVVWHGRRPSSLSLRHAPRSNRANPCQMPALPALPDVFQRRLLAPLAKASVPSSSRRPVLPPLRPSTPFSRRPPLNNGLPPKRRQELPTARRAGVALTIQTNPHAQLTTR